MIVRWMERLLLASRWLLAPLFLGLVVCLFALLIKAGQHVYHVAETLMTATESEVILSVLGLVDLTLAASLVLIIMFSGYENFITTITTESMAARPAWLSQIDFTGMKLKLLASIVSISAIQLLREFMSIAERTDRELLRVGGRPGLCRSCRREGGRGGDLGESRAARRRAWIGVRA